MNGSANSSKRTAPSYIPSTSTSSSANTQASKKARFDTRNPSTLAQSLDPEEDADPILELDEIGKGGLKSKRNAVKLEGYDSDSENENFNDRAQQRAKEQKGAEKGKGKSADEEQDDMFEDLAEDFADGDDDEELSREAKQRKKEVRFLDEREIEGQVSNSKSGGHVSADFTLNAKKSTRDVEKEESSDEDEPDDGEEYDEELGAGARKKHAPKLDAFNMKEEQQEGKFDESGNFVRNAADPFALHDQWLEDSKKSDIKKAKEAHDRRIEQSRLRAHQEDATATSDLLAVIIKYTKPGETILEALQRYGTGPKKQKPKWKKNVPKNKATPMDVDEQENEDPKETERKKAVEGLTGAADKLSSRVDVDDVFDEERGFFQRLYKSETGEDWADNDADVDNVQWPEAGAGAEWEYRWEDSRDGGETHGPYDSATMAAWEEAGYFGEGVLFKKVGNDDWTSTGAFSA